MPSPSCPTRRTRTGSTPTSRRSAEARARNRFLPQTTFADRKGTMYLDMFRLDGQVAVVTGGGRSIGLAIVEALAEAGARVIIADHDPAVAEEGLSALREK